MDSKTMWRRILGWRVGDRVRLKKAIRGIQKRDGFSYPYMIAEGTEGRITKIGCFGDYHLIAIEFPKGRTAYGIHEKDVKYFEREYE